MFGGEEEKPRGVVRRKREWDRTRTSVCVCVRVMSRRFLSLSHTHSSAKGGKLEKFLAHECHWEIPFTSRITIIHFYGQKASQTEKEFLCMSAGGKMDFPWENFSYLFVGVFLINRLSLELVRQVFKHVFQPNFIITTKTYKKLKNLSESRQNLPQHTYTDTLGCLSTQGGKFVEPLQVLVVYNVSIIDFSQVLDNFPIFRVKISPFLRKCR